MHEVSQQLDQMLDRLDAETAKLLEQAVRDAVALAVQRTNGRIPHDNLGYPVGYFEATAGSFADEPLERPQSLPLEAREPW